MQKHVILLRADLKASLWSDYDNVFGQQWAVDVSGAAACEAAESHRRWHGQSRHMYAHSSFMSAFWKDLDNKRDIRKPFGLVNLPSFFFLPLLWTRIIIRWYCGGRRGIVIWHSAHHVFVGKANDARHTASINLPQWRSITALGKITILLLGRF